MKLKFIEAPSKSADKLGDVTFDFSKVAGNTWKSLVPVKLPNSGVDSDSRVFLVNTPVTIACDRTTNKAGATRVMLKVSVPYQAISPDVADDAIVANQFDSRRSGGEMTAHVVVSLPKSAVVDLKGVSGSTCQRAAYAQSVLLMRLLYALFGQLQSAPLAADSVAQVEDPDTGIANDEHKLLDIPMVPADSDLAARTAIRTGDGPLLVYPAGSRNARGKVAKVSATTTISGGGIDLTDFNSYDVDLNDPLIQAINGLAPLGDETVIGAPVLMARGPYVSAS